MRPIMLDELRIALRVHFDDAKKISNATGIEVEDLRRFAWGGLFIPSGYDLDALVKYFGLTLRAATVTDLLPLESPAMHGIRDEFKEEFEFAAKVLKEALALIGSTPRGSGTLPKGKKPKAMSETARATTLGIYSKVIKQLRSTIFLCEAGLTDDAAALNRCMFEAVLAMNFLLRPRVALKENGKYLKDLASPQDKLCPHCKGVTLKAVTPPKLKKLGSRMRFLLYAHHICREAEKHIRACKEAGLDPGPDVGDPQQTALAAAKAKKCIGDGWYKRQKQSGTYMGVSVRDLAESYGYLPYYTGVYRMQSWTVHGVDATAFFDNDRDKGTLLLNLGPNPKGIKAMLYFASSHCIQAMELLNHRFGFWEKERIKRLVREAKTFAKDIGETDDQPGQR